MAKTEDTTEIDPSIEEILASIRQIISDDEPESVEATEDVDSTPDPEPEEDIEEEDDVFELTKDMEEESEDELEEDVNIDFMAQDNEEPEESETDIFTETAASATAGAFSKLTENVALSHYSDNITLEEIVKDMLRPMLREWIDSNMPRLVKVLVEKELEKLARHARDS